jgi:hypothetical protein
VWTTGAVSKATSCCRNDHTLLDGFDRGRQTTVLDRTKEKTRKKEKKRKKEKQKFHGDANK